MSEKLNSRQCRKLAAEEHQKQREIKEANRAALIAARLAEQNSNAPKKKTSDDIAAECLLHTVATFGSLIQPTLFGQKRQFKGK